MQFLVKEISSNIGDSNNSINTVVLEVTYNIDNSQYVHIHTQMHLVNHDLFYFKFTIL